MKKIFKDAYDCPARYNRLARELSLAYRNILNQVNFIAGSQKTTMFLWSLSLIEDRNRQIYLSTNKGITCLSPDEWNPAAKQNNFANGKKVLSHKNFSIEDGLPGNERVVSYANDI